MFEKKGNMLNDLQPRQYEDFLRTVTQMPRTSPADLDAAVEIGSVPVTALADVLAFFTKPGDRVLDVFSGSGRMLTLAESNEREVVGIDMDRSKLDAFLTEREQDMFTVDQPELDYRIGDALDVVKGMKGKEEFDFAFLDFPRNKPSCTKRRQQSPDCAALLPEDYVEYVVSVVEASAAVIKANKFVAVKVDDAYHRGEFRHLSGEIAAQARKIQGLKLRLFKTWFYHRNHPAGNLQIPVPIMNAAYLLSFHKAGADE